MGASYSIFIRNSIDAADDLFRDRKKFIRSTIYGENKFNDLHHSSKMYKNNDECTYCVENAVIHNINMYVDGLSIMCWSK